MTQAAKKTTTFDNLIFPVTVESQFGEIVIQKDDLISMPDGLYGLEEYTNFGIVPLPQQQEKVFSILQCLDEPGLIFLLSPLRQKEGLIIAEEDLKEATDTLKIKFENCDFFAIATVRASGQGVNLSLNLKAPIIFDRTTKKAWQYVLENKDYPIEHTLKYKN